MDTDTAATAATEERPAPRERALAVANAVPASGLSLFNDPASFAFGQRMAMMLSNTSVLPDAYRAVYQKNSAWVQNPDAVGNCFIALELANRLKASPLVVMQQVDMIHGRPALRGTFLIALVNGSGLFSELEFECNELPGDAYGYRARATNLKTGKDCVGPWITWDMVKKEGWSTKGGSKWQSMPELMFQYRAASFWSRLFAPHITLGLYESEEAQDFIEGDFTPVNTTAARLNAATAEPEAAPADATPGNTVAPAVAKRSRARARPAAEADDASVRRATATDSVTVGGEAKDLNLKPVDGNTAVDPPHHGVAIQDDVPPLDPTPAGPVIDDAKDAALPGATAAMFDVE